jgi:hypothetical protein
MGRTGTTELRVKTMLQHVEDKNRRNKHNITLNISRVDRHQLRGENEFTI